MSTVSKVTTWRDICKPHIYIRCMRAPSQPPTPTSGKGSFSKMTSGTSYILLCWPFTPAPRFIKQEQETWWCYTNVKREDLFIRRISDARHNIGTIFARMPWDWTLTMNQQVQSSWDEGAKRWIRLIWAFRLMQDSYKRRRGDRLRHHITHVMVIC